jgi:hypothetical protein
VHEIRGDGGREEDEEGEREWNYDWWQQMSSETKDKFKITN